VLLKVLNCVKHDVPPMHSIISRVNNVSALFSSCMMGLLVAIALSSLVFTADPKGDLEIASIKV
jgi:signal peptidase complex subunit 3